MKTPDLEMCSTDEIVAK